MYPRVKVRELDEDDDHEARTWPRLEAFDSLSTYDLNSPAWECDDDSPRPIIRIPESYISNLANREGKSSDKKQDANESKPNIRASPILRPRAVLSSPDNDGMIGSTSKAKADLLCGLRNHNLCQNRHARCKVIPSRNTNETLITTRREPVDTANHKTDIKEKKRAVTAGPRQRPNLRKVRPDFVI